MSGAARPGIIGEMARNKFLMSRKNLKKVTMLKDFTNMEETDDGKDGIKSTVSNRILLVFARKTLLKWPNQAIRVVQGSMKCIF